MLLFADYLMEMRILVLLRGLFLHCMRKMSVFPE